MYAISTTSLYFPQFFDKLPGNQLKCSSAKTMLLVCLMITLTAKVLSAPRSEPRSVGSCVGDTVYYFNTEKWLCIVKKATECPDNKKSFKTLKGCFSVKPKDTKTCAGAALPGYPEPPGMDATVKRSCREILEEVGCPSGYSCMGGVGGGTCCHNATYEKYSQVWSKKCPNGHAALNLKRPGTNWRYPFAGDSCSTLPCPKNYECVQVNDIFAMCCKD